jgi:hypothetical protein
MGVAVGELSVREGIQAGLREVAANTCRSGAIALLNYKSGRVKKRRQEPSGGKFCLYAGEATRIKGHKRIWSVFGMPKADLQR